MIEEMVTYIKGSEKNEIPVETICNEMAHILQIDNLSFLIGAGCSSYINEGKEVGIPGMRSVYNDFFTDNPNFEIAGEKAKNKCEKNLEKVLETMNAILVVNDLKCIDNEIEDKIKQVQSFLRIRIKEGQKGESVKSIYKDFYSKISQCNRKTPINIFTTNYDLYNEMALDELGFHYNNGFAGTYKRRFSPASYNYAYVENMNLSHDVWEQVSTYFNVIKLHGSISWIRDSEELQERDIDYIKDTETVMIYPTPMKDRSTLMSPYSDLFRIMENKLLQKNSTLIVMGYSFGDEHINRIILNGLAVPTFNLVVFGESENINRLAALHDSRITIINSGDKIHYFNNIVNKVLPEIHPDIKEKLELKSTETTIKSFEEGDIDE